jgi:quercetin dioxygenase-like cupin family protein
MSDYFSTDKASGLSMRVVRNGEHPTVTLTTGIRGDALLGERLNILVVTLDPNAEAPAHAHDEEQMGFIVRGWLEFFDNGRTEKLGPGDTYHAPPGAIHGARAGDEGCVLIDVFSPPRAGLREALDGS